MTQQQSRIVSVGEVMVEMARDTDGRFIQGCGGDTFNTAIYLARHNLDVGYASALGTDPYSESILALARAENIACDLVLQLPDRLPGLYLIETDQAGERSFHYWREQAPAREIFERPEWSRIAEGLLAAGMIYFSGITLSLYSNAGPDSNVGLGRFLATLEMARAAGTKIVFDGNYRPRGWKGDTARARRIFMEALRRVDLALPTFEDEALLWGDASPEATIERLRACGITEIALKNGTKSALICADDKCEAVPVPDVIKPLDTTGAGDSFNAGYLAARLQGEPPAKAALAGHRLAGKVVQHRGAIIPR